MQVKRMRICRWVGDGEMAIDRYEKLIAALVLAGYEVSEHGGFINFVLGADDEIEIIKGADNEG